MDLRLWGLIILFSGTFSKAADLQLSTDPETLTAEQKAGHLMMVGIKGKTLNDSTRRWVRDRHVGGIILFPTNLDKPDQIQKLIRDIQDTTHAPSVLIAIDQEGGKVRRLQKDVTFLPSAMSLGNTFDPGLSYLLGLISARELLYLGINVNLAPVLDLYRSRQDHLIGTRSFGTHASTVTQMGKAYIRALQHHGVSATAKHFPGHGEVSGDSHFTLPRSQISLKEWENTHLPPFQSAIRENVHMIMTAHVRFPKILRELQAPKEEEDLPATFSPTLIQEVLRKRLHYDGIVVTDDIEMQAIRRRWSYGEAAVRTILAGSDLVMVAWSDQAKDEVWRALTQAIRTKRIPPSRVDEAILRIQKIQTLHHDYIHPQAEASVLRHPFHRQTASLIRKMGLALFETKKTQPFKLRAQPLKVFASHPALLKQIRQFMKPLSEHLSTHLLTSQLTQVQKNSTYFFILRNQTDHNQLQELWKTLHAPDVETPEIVVASMDSPRLLLGFESAQALLCTFNNDSIALESLGDFLLNKLEVPPATISLKEFY